MSLLRVMGTLVVVSSTVLSPVVSGSSLESRLSVEAQPFSRGSEPGEIVDWLPSATALNKTKVKADPDAAGNEIPFDTGETLKYEMDHEAGLSVSGPLVLSLFGMFLVTIGLLRGKRRL